MITAIVVIQAVAFAVFSGIVANNKNRDPGKWSVWGFLFGIFGFIAALVVEEVGKKEVRASSQLQSQSSHSDEFDSYNHERKCPDYAEYIKLEARVCRYCGHELSDEEVERLVEQRRSV